MVGGERKGRQYNMEIIFNFSYEKNYQKYMFIPMIRLKFATIDCSSVLYILQ